MENLRANPLNQQILKLILSSPDRMEELTGRIIAAGQRDYVFVGDVVNASGHPVDTGAGDVFLHRDDFNGGSGLETGAVVKFKIIPDEKRPGCVRAIDAHPENTLITLPEVGVKSELIYPVSVRTGKTSLVHLRQKEVPQEMIERAIMNKPFEGMIRPSTAEEAVQMANQEKLAQMVSVWFLTRFPALEPFGVNFDITDPGESDADEAQAITDYVRSLGTGAMAGAAEDLKRSYQVFCNVRSIFRYLYVNKLVLPQAIVPVRFLPDLVMAAPVWFARSRFDLPDTRSQADPKTDRFLRYICGLVGTQRFGDLFQVFNRRTRSFDTYQGDLIPPHIWDIIRQCCGENGMHLELFDYLTIATPYVHLSARELADPKWHSSIDPYLIGFLEDLPEVMFVLGRWSDTGLFPNTDKMIADTVSYLSSHSHLLENFSEGSPYWWDITRPDSEDAHLEGRTLVPRLKELVKGIQRSFSDGNMFSFLTANGALTAE